MLARMFPVCELAVPMAINQDLKLLESDELATQARNNTKAQFANSPTLREEMMNAIMDALAAHQAMSKQALDSQRVRDDMKDVLLGPGQLYEALRDRG